jgi:hypothetical protein
VVKYEIDPALPSLLKKKKDLSQLGGDSSRKIKEI